jgi:hypothetical protein
MSVPMRCRLTGCDLNECGVCRRCGSEKNASHQWKAAERTEPCYELKICERCGAEHKKPDHDWVPTGAGAALAEVQGPELKCSRCGLVI